MGIVNIQNFSEVKYRTDCFAGEYRKFHTRKNAVISSVTYNKGTSSEYTTNYETYPKNYEKLRDIEALYPDESVHSLEIGYDPYQYSDIAPVVADRLILWGDYTPASMLYSHLIFEKPAIGVLPNPSASVITQDFMLFDEIHLDGASVLGSGRVYENGSYSSVQNKHLADLVVYSYIPNPLSSTGWEDTTYLASTIDKFAIGIHYTTLSQNAAGDQTGPDGGFYGAGNSYKVRESGSEICSNLRITESEKPELYNLIMEEYALGGVIVPHSFIDYMDAIQGNSHHAQTGLQTLEPSGSGSGYIYVNHPPGFLQNIIIPFINENEREAAKSTGYFWTVAQRNSFNNIYGE